MGMRVGILNVSSPVDVEVSQIGFIPIGSPASFTLDEGESGVMYAEALGRSISVEQSPTGSTSSVVRITRVSLKGAPDAVLRITESDGTVTELSANGQSADFTITDDNTLEIAEVYP